MASAMADHLRGLRPALALGPAAGGPCWADRIVYSVGTFDRPRFSPDPAAAAAATTTAYSASAVSSHGGWMGGGGGSGGGGAATRPEGTGEKAMEAAANGAVNASANADAERESPLRFLREFGAVVVVGVYSGAAHAAVRGGDRVRPADSTEARCARVRPHADRVVVVDSPDPARAREILLGAAAAAAAAAGVDVPNNNCCFVVCDWGGGGGGGAEAVRRARDDVREVMEASMPVFRLPSPSWDCCGSASEEEEEEEEEG
ncbi:unnamed protein product, partial [Laminaria digitata]